MLINGFSIFTFASRMGEERSTDLARSLPAYFSNQLFFNNGQFNIVQALTTMPEYIGFTTCSQSEVPQIMTTAIDWSEEKRQFLETKFNEERAQMLNGFNPQPFITANDSDSLEDEFPEEEEKSRMSKSYFTFQGNHPLVKHIFTYQPY